MIDYIIVIIVQNMYWGTKEFKDKVAIRREGDELSLVYPLLCL